MFIGDRHDRNPTLSSPVSSSTFRDDMSGEEILTRKPEMFGTFYKMDEVPSPVEFTIWQTNIMTMEHHHVGWENSV